MNVDVNKYLKKIIELDDRMTLYRHNSDADIARYRQRNENKLAALNAYLKEAEDKSFEIKSSKLAEAQKTIDKQNEELNLMLESSQKNFNEKKSQIVQELFDELFA